MTLPEGWVEATIDDVADYVSRGKSPKYVDKSSLPVVNQRSVRWSGIEPTHLKFLDPATANSWAEERTLRPGDILWNSTGTGTIGRAALFQQIRGYDRVVADSHVTVVRSNAEIVPEYLFNLIRSPAVQDVISDMQNGSTNQVELARSAVLGTKVPLPPAAEQRRIVAKLDALTARLARARAELDRVPVLAEQLKRSTLIGAFSGSLTAAWRAENRNAQPVRPRSQDELRSKYRCHEANAEPYLIPNGWRWLRLPELGDLDRGKSRHRPRNDARLFGGEHPFVQTGDVRAAGQYLTDFSETYSDFGLAQSRKWPEGTVCITIAANIAETTVLGISACFPDSVVGFSADDDKAIPEYIEYFIRTAKADLERFAPATAQKNINLDTLGALAVPTPPVSEQRAILSRIDAAFARADRMEAEAASARALIDRLEAAILAKAFRGELVPQDPNDEPAHVLLDRIRAERAARGATSSRRGRKKAGA